METPSIPQILCRQQFLAAGELTVLTVARSEASDAGRFTRQFWRCTTEISAAVAWFFLGAMMLFVFVLTLALRRWARAR